MIIKDKSKNGILLIAGLFPVPEWEMNYMYSADMMEQKIRRGLVESAMKLIQEQTTYFLSSKNNGELVEYNYNICVIERQRLNNLLAAESELKLFKKYSNESVKNLVRREQTENDIKSLIG